MKIFDWAKEIEDIYEELLKKSKNQNLEEIEKLQAETEKMINESLNKKQNLSNEALKSVSKDVKKEISTFKEKIKDILKNFEQTYNQNKKDLINNIIKELGLDFSA